MANPLHDTVFNFLEEYRYPHPDFMYWLRERNTGNRLLDGYWFQGNLDYAYVGLYDRSGGSNKTRSIGIYFSQLGQNIKTVFEVVFNEEEDERLLKLYAEIMKRLGGFNRLSDTRFQKTLSITDGFAAAKDFLNNERPVVDEAIREMNLEEIFIEKDDFDSKLKHILSIMGNPASSLFPPSKIEELKTRYATFKNDDFFKERIRQLRFIPFAQKIISNFLKNELTNETLTGLIQVLKNGAKSETVSYHIDKNIADINLRSGLKKEFSEFGFTGYTGAGKTGINGLDEGQLETVKKFILDCAAIKTTEEANKRVEEFDALKTPQVKCGVYSPWLYYMNPSVFPIKNNSHDGFIQWCNQPTGSYPTAILLFHEVAEILGEKDLGLIDAFTHMFSEEDMEEETETILNHKEKNIMNLNTILYGPPGTGKTYNTINKAIEIIDKEFYKINKDKRAALHDRFNDLLIKDFDKLEGQIAFCTFHQSMSYEDFIEGIKPVLTTDKNDGISYEIKDGIFKTIARMASDSLEEKEIIKEKRIALTEKEFNQALFYKMSLGNTQLEGDEEIYEYCLANECVAMGWGGNVNYAGMDENEIFKAAKAEGQTDFSAQQANMFIHYLKAGNYVIISNGNHRFRAIGRIIGEYEYRNDTPLQGYYHYKKVEWIIKDQDLPVSDIYGRNFQQQTLYKLKQQEVKKEFFIKDRAEEIPEKIKEPKKFVLIIDEINRGNVSQIFGELITLIEEDKRTGEDEAITATLPYSKKAFSVPPNLYIIGTMNTADRSVEALDTALRRRFVFEEIDSNTSLLHPKQVLSNFWNKYEYLDLTYEQWIEEPYKSETDKVYELLGMSRELEKEILHREYSDDRNYWIVSDLEDVSDDQFTGIKLNIMLQKINERLQVLLTKDHTIGHAWLMNVYNINDLQLVFKNKIIPLLQEFFYNDYAKIGLVLGEQFIEPKPVKTDLFAKFKGSEELAGDYTDKIIYELKDVAHIELQGFKSI